MKYFKILPAAAIGFASEIGEADDTAAFRILVETRELKHNSEQQISQALPAAMHTQGGQVYRVEIKRGNATSVVLIDIYSGKILGNTRGTDQTA
jgi:hypothetical protein